jgi:hypothetical protein
MYLQFSLLALGSVLLYGQASPSDAAPGIQDVRIQVAAGLAPRTRVDQAKDAIAAARDAELLNASLSLNDLTEDKAAQLEQAARRQLDRAKAQVEQVRTLVDAGLQPKQSLTAPLEEQALAQNTYDLTLSRTELVQQVAEMARLEEQIPLPQPRDTGEDVGFAPPVMEKFDGRGSFTPADFQRVKDAFEQEFHKTLPVSADGETAVHQAMGFDHRNRVDVALFPDTTEGVWLRHYLESSAIPYYAFRSFVPGKATAAHIHIGPPSGHLAAPGRS